MPYLGCLTSRCVANLPAKLKLKRVRYQAFDSWFRIAVDGSRQFAESRNWRVDESNRVDVATYKAKVLESCWRYRRDLCSDGDVTIQFPPRFWNAWPSWAPLQDRQSRDRQPKYLFMNVLPVSNSSGWALVDKPVNPVNMIS